MAAEAAGVAGAAGRDATGAKAGKSVEGKWRSGAGCDAGGRAVRRGGGGSLRSGAITGYGRLRREVVLGEAVARRTLARRTISTAEKAKAVAASVGDGAMARIAATEGEEAAQLLATVRVAPLGGWRRRSPRRRSGQKRDLMLGRRAQGTPRSECLACRHGRAGLIVPLQPMLPDLCWLAPLLRFVSSPGPALPPPAPAALQCGGSRAVATGWTRDVARQAECRG